MKEQRPPTAFESFLSQFLFLIKIGGVGAALLMASCGYTLRGTENPLRKREGIGTVYVTPLINNTYKAGVENYIYNNMIRVILSQRQLILVRDPKDADGIINGVIQTASYGGISANIVAGLSPSGIGSSLPSAGFGINSIYNATLTCLFELVRTQERRGRPRTVWSASFTRTKPFPSANQLDVPGTTSPLINESEFERALSDLSREMVADVHEKMLDIF